MRKYFYIAFLFIGFTSCDDGDIIINNFDFDDAQLVSCGKEGKVKVLYIINNDDIFETISLQATSTSFSEISKVLTTNPTIEFDLSSTNRLIYRTYDGTVPSTYFCSDIPPSTPQVNEEFISVGGKVIITTNRNLEGVTDKDGDGVLDAEELDEDTDDDGIMNVDDIDDDGDNVLTKNETANANDDPVVGRFRDTDEDGTPNYLDEDDDGDEVKTKFEVTEAFQDPNVQENANAEGLANYLNPAVTNSFLEVTFVKENKISVKYRSIITIENLQLQSQDGTGEVISFQSYDLGDFNSIPTDLIIAPTPTETDN
ncbi:hypothetical protein [Gillisia hiemivivida]|uniref:Calcium-binding protein n=1 Tax=Gillisia hiemivivida TaxID=291190 RepID=A0A5C6ZNN1_9FLAO|nr:hypothetical protein [Gillisia hiemivivida]TXD92270.1 hypothetical protein ES724_14210 [Gillisia hiemivivida]